MFGERWIPWISCISNLVPWINWVIHQHPPRDGNRLVETCFHWATGPCKNLDPCEASDCCDIKTPFESIMAKGLRRNRNIFYSSYFFTEYPWTLGDLKCVFFFNSVMFRWAKNFRALQALDYVTTTLATKKTCRVDVHAQTLRCKTQVPFMAANPLATHLFDPQTRPKLFLTEF